MQKKCIKISISVPYCTLNELTDKTKNIWFCLHGQGQLAEYFIKKWEILNPEENFIIAPQGISKYYLSGFNGRVGASWMTKQDRLTEIKNQQELLRSVWETEVCTSKNCKVIFFGFSQGASTVSRFIAYSKIPFHHFVLWAGEFPPDVDSDDYSHLSGKEQVSVFLSKDDEYFREEYVKPQLSRIREKMRIEPELINYEGGHRVIAELLKTIV